MASAPAPATPTPRATAHARLFVDAAGERVLFAEAGEGVAACISALLTDPLSDVAESLLRDDPAACFGNLVAIKSLPLPAGPAYPYYLAAPRAGRAPAPAGMGIMSRRLFRCGHLGCRCSDVASRAPGSACPCASPSCAAAAGGGATRDTELHFLEACFYRRPDGSSAAASRGAGRSGDTFYRCRARDERRGGRDVFPCRYRVTDERGVVCPLCHGPTTVAVRCARDSDDGSSGSSSAAARYAIMDDLSVRPVAAGLSDAELLSALGVAADPAAVRVVTQRGTIEIAFVSSSLRLRSIVY